MSPTSPSHRFFNTHRVLNCLFAFFSFLSLASGVTLAGVALMWMFPFTTTTYSTTSAMASNSTSSSSTIPINVGSSTASLSPQGLMESISFLNLVLTDLEFIFALTLGVMLMATFFTSLPAFMMKRSSKGLIVLNIAIAVDILAILAGAGTVWLRSLRTRAEFWEMWQAGGSALQLGIQTQWNCCGYWDAMTLVVSDSCSANHTTTLGNCVDPFSAYASDLLMSIATFMYGACGILGFWFLTNLSIVGQRNLEHRYVLIDRKRRYKKFTFA